MNWIKCSDKLPENRHSVLGFCYNENKEFEWMGFVQVYFERETGWKLCELYDDKPVKVLYWTQDIPKPI